GQCSTGSIQCCQNVVPGDSDLGTLLLDELGIVLEDPTVLIGDGCDPITVAGSSDACSATAVCCSDNNVSGVIAIGCLPVTL
ncbi:uncharacterized protein PHACADRAFT_78259, partial [Phanerochaete carnosa HHB-10118-sp]